MRISASVPALTILAMALAACASSVSDAAPDAAARGRSFAERSCAGCHAIGADDAASPNPAAPAFVSLASRADITPTSLKVLLRTPHRDMPDFIVALDDVEDLAAYLDMLR